MKRVSLLLIIFVLMISLCACGGEKPLVTAPPTTEPPVTEPPATEPLVTEPLVTEPPAPAFDYKTLECREITEWQDIGLTWEGSEKVLYMHIPADWELERQGVSEYIIFSDNTEVGRITTELSDATFDTLETLATYKKDNIEVDYDVRCVHEEWGDEYRRVFGFWVVGEEIRSVYLDIDYTAINDNALLPIYTSVDFGDRDGGELFLNLEQYNSSDKILIIGNSFVGDKFSAISITLDQLLKSGGKTQYKFENITIYNKSIKDYIKDPYITDMRNGKYKLVFMCGIYGSGDVNGMQTAIDACRQSNTGLVFFMAHNEKDDWIAEAQKRYPDQLYLDWRAEIDSFIYSDETYWDFCMNDGPRHSTPLGGYVGAHMIYKAVFHEVPPAYQSTSLLSVGKIMQRLGEEYVNTGVCKNELSYPVYELK